MPTSGRLYVWVFAQRGKAVNVRLDGPLIFNTTPPQVDAAVAGLGAALLPEDEVAAPLADGRLLRVLQDWCPPFDGYHLCYRSRRQPSPACGMRRRHSVCRFVGISRSRGQAARIRLGSRCTAHERAVRSHGEQPRVAAV